VGPGWQGAGGFHAFDRPKAQGHRPVVAVGVDGTRHQQRVERTRQELRRGLETIGGGACHRTTRADSSRIMASDGGKMPVRSRGVVSACSTRG
jgi:hypothetical protein